MATIHLIDAEKAIVSRRRSYSPYQLFLDHCNIGSRPHGMIAVIRLFQYLLGKRVKEKAIFSEDRQFDDSPDIIFDTCQETPVIL
jgi:hypothetical protein